MERRAFILATISGGLLTAPLAAQAQQAGKVYRLGILSPTAPPAPSDRAVTSLLVPAVLREMGYVEGQNLVVERRYADNQFARLPDLARQLVELRMDVILAVGNDAPGAARDVSTTIPIVMLGRDPVKLGYVASLARPGGNITGVVISETGLADKRLELLREASNGDEDRPSRLRRHWNQGPGPGGGKSRSIPRPHTAGRRCQKPGL
jgi:putative ABC transport system substrate-binding protein